MASKGAAVTAVAFLPPSRFSVRFADGRQFEVDVAALEMPVELLRWDTIAVAAGGAGVTMLDVCDEPLDVDADTVRFFVDPEFAVAAKAELNRSQLTRAELEELARESQRWWDGLTADQRHALLSSSAQERRAWKEWSPR